MIRDTRRSALLGGGFGPLVRLTICALCELGCSSGPAGPGPEPAPDRGPAAQYVVISPQAPDEFLEPGVLDDMIAKLGRGRPTRRLAWMVRVLGFQEYDAAAVRSKLRQAFALAEGKDLPLAFHIDFEFWWENRPDLWNWWDPTQPGYDWHNRYNVEWADWNTPTTSRTLNWGRPVMIKPHPCFGSPGVEAEVRQRKTIIAQEVAAWRSHLKSVGRSDLFVGINPTGETSIDPGLGYCALHFRGFDSANPPTDMTSELHLADRDYAHFEVRSFREAGFLIGQLSTHAPPWDNLLFTAVNPDSTPGFSLYAGGFAISDVMDVVGDRDWIVAESGWQTLAALIDQPRLRWIALYNWAHGIGPDDPCCGGAPIADNPAALSTINNVLYAAHAP